MKLRAYRHSVAFALTAALAAGLPGQVTAQAPVPDARDWTGAYGGSYQCRDGAHGIHVEIASVTAEEDGSYAVSGVLGFFPLIDGGGPMAHVAGSFAVAGTITPDHIIRLEPLDWLVEAPGYGAAALLGELLLRRDGLWQILGMPVVPGDQLACSDLLATQFLPAS
ncbi:MAG: hypothetical protein KIS96_06845 [Bauldia sp.]|nr:hypothetical protein [Bauldia sp.]